MKDDENFDFIMMSKKIFEVKSISSEYDKLGKKVGFKIHQ